ncbi:hypothetical protein TRFO_01720 [Tritrichomonas foetus]|uniref:Uncharacterized protein n=1 Tax=Tritrichomonas foetus TaxID=1144522 RepID=A0A1J4JV38_9EUKA|nr:hypothetical protein TRFO_01720 [Tritrichomonas foetus]|eukprot:OHT01125.1 hypothetical protein TRFO_01720 [Tritrichomonas foetus]
MPIFFLFFSVISGSSFLVIQQSPPTASAEESRSASIITRNAKQKIDKCYENLGKTMNDLCINLDVDKRIKLAIAIMICEQSRDGRSDQLPVYDSDFSFITQLDSESFNIFTIYFINIDTICFHAVHENITSVNMERILSVFQAVSLSTEFLNTARQSLDELMVQVRKRFVEYQKLFDEERSKFQAIQNSVVQTIQTVKSISEKATYYQSIATNAKFYFFTLGIAFIVSFFLPNVFLPVLFVIAIYLAIECSVPNEKIRYTSHYLYKWSFVFVCFIILMISVSDKYQLLQKKKAKKNKKQRCGKSLKLSESITIETAYKK